MRKYLEPKRKKERRRVKGLTSISNRLLCKTIQKENKIKIFSDDCLRQGEREIEIETSRRIAVCRFTRNCNYVKRLQKRRRPTQWWNVIHLKIKRYQFKNQRKRKTEHCKEFISKWHGMFHLIWFIMLEFSITYWYSCGGGSDSWPFN